jgi:hypothetical protein
LFCDYCKVAWENRIDCRWEPKAWSEFLRKLDAGLVIGSSFNSLCLKISNMT